MPRNPPSSQSAADWSAADDLTPILRRLTARRKKPEAKRRLANDQVTRLFLEAGLGLITDQMKATEPVEETDANQDGDQTRAFFSWLSRHKVLAEAETMADSLSPNEAKFRDRWEFQGDYIEDLLAYCLWQQHWSLHMSNAGDTYALLTRSQDFVSAIQELAYNDLNVLWNNPAYKISLIGAATADRDPVARQAIAATYKTMLEAWSRVYAATIQARGLRLRKDVSLQELTDMLTALADGVGLRFISDPDANLIDHTKHESLLGKAAIALAVACIDPGDGQSLEEALRLRVQGDLKT